MSDLKDRLVALEKKTNVRPCPFAELIELIDSDTAELLEKLVDNTKIPIRSIHEELQKEGYRIARETISNHRKGWCRCKGVTQ